jgi:hypothetical protein
MHAYGGGSIILSDANLSPFATRLKVGTTALVLNSWREAPPVTRWPASSRDSTIPSSRCATFPATLIGSGTD